MSAETNAKKKAADVTLAQLEQGAVAPKHNKVSGKGCKGGTQNASAQASAQIVFFDALAGGSPPEVARQAAADAFMAAFSSQEAADDAYKANGWARDKHGKWRNPLHMQVETNVGSSAASSGAWPAVPAPTATDANASQDSVDDAVLIEAVKKVETKVEAKAGRKAAAAGTALAVSPGPATSGAGAASTAVPPVHEAASGTTAAAAGGAAATPPPVRAAGQPGSKSVAEMLAAFRTETLATVQLNLDTMQAQLVEKMEGLFTEYDAAIKGHLNILDSDVVDLRSKYDNVIDDNKKLWAAIARLQEGLVQSNSTIPARVAMLHENFDRDSIPHKLLLSCKEVIDKDSLLQTVEHWLRECDLEDDAWHFVPGDAVDPKARSNAPGLSYKWSLFFHGGAQLAERRAIKCNTYLRRDDGTWNPLFVQTPTARQCRLFVGFDKS